MNIDEHDQHGEHDEEWSEWWFNNMTIWKMVIDPSKMGIQPNETIFFLANLNT